MYISNERQHKDYIKTHNIAKFIIFIINTALLYFTYKVDCNENTMMFVLAIYNLTYFYGVNTVARLIEKLTNKGILHDRI